MSDGILPNTALEDLFARIEALEEEVIKIKDHIHFLENIEPYDPAEDEAELLEKLKNDTVYTEWWY